MHRLALKVTQKHLPQASRHLGEQVPAMQVSFLGHVCLDLSVLLPAARFKQPGLKWDHPGRETVDCR